MAEPTSTGGRGLDAILRPLDLGAERLIVVAGAVMVAFVAAEVFSRYVLATSIFFANEVARLMFVWTIFLGLPLALARGRHVGITLLFALLPAPAGRLVFRAGCVLSAGLMAIVIWQTAGILLDNWDQRMSTLPLSAGLFTLPITIGASLALLHLVNMILTADPAAGIAPPREVEEDAP